MECPPTKVAVHLVVQALQSMYRPTATPKFSDESVYGMDVPLAQSRRDLQERSGSRGGIVMQQPLC